MKAPWLLILIMLLPALVTGCVIFPHGELVAPPAQGTVVDAETLQPLPQAKVVRCIERLERYRVTYTDAQGDFQLKRDRDLGWLLMVEYAANAIQYRIELAGYYPFETNLYGGGTLHGGRLPHALGMVLLHRQSHEIGP